ncbi:Uncharacterised protein [Mycobacteroides abscessus subsp. massiliense]|nr:hypothetical protein [Mycobacteroides abscessus subsp. massiliense]NOR98100.1 hypothetical protein [Mycobacteroides abscessus]SIE58741.1 Uncharacterised protein [Mycobacteroides abscessus subsp. abscessus]MBL3747675.1 hypothetical protein [Mycobacteroides abscessus subsp. massiliense]MBL3761734.1 hypothetical protein [Mycobacteroides abscessus subsp. massiliense]
MTDSRLAILQRTYDRAKRGRALKDWGLRPQSYDPGSSLALDDDGFMVEVGGLVNITALFPIMNATDNLAAVADLIDFRHQSKNAHISSLCSLCRGAVESAAKTIWLLSPTDRAERRARCIGFTNSELDAQRGFHAAERRRFHATPGHKSDPAYAQFVEHVRLFDERVDMMNGLKREKPPNSSGFVTKAGKWIDAHPPAHDHGLFANGFEAGVERFYALGSGFVHGYKWAMDYVQTGELDMFRMVADGLAAAVGMAECAVALYEAQAQRTGAPTLRQQHHPNVLNPTIAEWSALYS